MKTTEIKGKWKLLGFYLLVAAPLTPGCIGPVTLEPIGIPPVSNCLKQQYGAKTNLELNKKEWIRS
ncbi:MAG: hypothetical protein AB9861_05380 [Methanosarcina sp.]|jgi:hypothetical protein